MKEISEFKNLKPEIKKIVNMYVTARQFKNAIRKNEKVIVENGRIINRIYPYIVNKTFSCEIYLKLIIITNGESYKNIHNIVDLYKKSGIQCDFEKYITDNIIEKNKNYTLDKLYFDLDTISKAFINWRYIFEKDELNISEGILNILTDYLDEICLNIINVKYGIDMNKYTNI